MNPYRTYKITLESEDDGVFAEQRIAIDLAYPATDLFEVLKPDIERAVNMLIHQLKMKEERCRSLPGLPSSGSGS